MRRGFPAPGIGVILMFPLLPIAPALAQQPHAPRAEHGPYQVDFRHPLHELIRDLEETERGDRHLESTVPHREWYSSEIRRKMGSWGPRSRAYPPLPGLEHRSADWCRERAVAVGLRYLGYDYQHHHVPDWDPPQGWPWKPVGSGRNGRGVDCSNFTGFVFNQGFGIRLSTDVVKQSEQGFAEEGNGREWPIRRIQLPGSYEDRIHALKTGDLLYIRGRPDGPITHVVMWVGPIGRSSDGVPLILDSHGSGVLDDGGRSIPAGVQLRPFREHSWYNKCASHAHRVFEGP
ncbi:MAG: NlpC/P60 family protein [Isosphaeraceae bacterium]